MSIFDTKLTFPKDAILELSSSYSSTPRSNVPKRELKAAEKQSQDSSFEEQPAKTQAKKHKGSKPKVNKSFESHLKQGPSMELVQTSAVIDVDNDV